jgi:hypothetical protein
MITEKHDSTEKTRTRRALIEVVTENGFSIMRSCDDCEIVQEGCTYEYRFIVSYSDGLQSTVAVRFAPSAIAAIQRKRRSPLAPENSFWIACAERSLATYLSEGEHLPPGGKLLLEEMCLAELEVARRWEIERAPQADHESSNRSSGGTLGKSFYVQSLIAILFLYFIAAFAPDILAANLSYLRGVLSNLILYAAIFLSGTLAGLTMNDIASVNALFKMATVSELKIPEQSVPPYDEQGLTPVERVIHKR